jgi:hypothetical protein
MRKIWTLSIIALLFSSCITTRNNNNKANVVDPYLPKIIENMSFGMSLQEATEARKDMAPINYVRDEFSFRKEYIEEFDDPAVERVIYYFDAEGNMPFYEAIITYKTAEALNVDASLLFGPPNYEGKEWRLESKDKVEIQAWKFDRKLVVVGVLAGTEWSEETME